MKNYFQNKPSIRNRGVMLVQTLVFAAIAIIMITALVGWAATNLNSSREAYYREQAFEIAEAGVEYYRWHLAHAPTDYKDGTNQAGPYVHDYKDKNGNVIGTFSLDVIAPTNGSTKVTVRSKGISNAYPGIYRRIEVQLAKPSFAKYQMVTNASVFYGTGDEVFGPIHSNKQVVFQTGNPQPVAHNIVTSALDFLKSGNTYSYGVSTTINPADPTAQSPNKPALPPPTRNDVFQAGRQFPVPAVDFSGITADLSAIRTEAQNNGFWKAAAGNGSPGYHVVLKNNNTFDLYKITALQAAPNGCTNSANPAEAVWGTWSINNNGAAQTAVNNPQGNNNYAIPANGLIFFDDNVWIDGTVNGTRATIAVGTFPTPGNIANMKNIVVNNDLKYTNFDGRDVIALIAQGNFFVGLNSADNLTIDAAVVAQNGGTVRNYYNPNKCGATSARHALTTYGMFASNTQGYFYWGNSGYSSQPATYDPNLLYGPPPQFPLTSDTYQVLYWQEIK